MGRGRGRGPKAGTSRVHGRVYGITPLAESEDQLVIQGMFFLSRLWARLLIRMHSRCFDSTKFIPKLLILP